MAFSEWVKESAMLTLGCIGNFSPGPSEACLIHLHMTSCNHVETIAMMAIERVFIYHCSHRPLDGQTSCNRNADYGSLASCMSHR